MRCFREGAIRNGIGRRRITMSNGLDEVPIVVEDGEEGTVTPKGSQSIQRFGSCGVMAQITVSVSTSGVVTVAGNASGGSGCTWQGMEVLVQLRNATTGLWESKPGYDGSGTTWTDDFDGTGYDKYRAKTTSLDSLVSEFEEILHRVTTGWLKGLI
jgi:hypothetical protein